MVDEQCLFFCVEYQAVCCFQDFKLGIEFLEQVFFVFIVNSDLFEIIVFFQYVYIVQQVFRVVGVNGDEVIWIVGRLKVLFGKSGEDYGLVVNIDFVYLLKINL